ncbi:MAG: hypothetical protein ABW063_04985 [Caulobacter sp.]
MRGLGTVERPNGASLARGAATPAASFHKLIDAEKALIDDEK